MNNELLAVMQEEDQNSLEHYGVKGQKWGQRNYQNPDGSYTELGKIRRRVAYKKLEAEEAEKNQNKSETDDIKIGGKAYKDMTRKELRAAKKRARHNEAERRATREFNRDKRQAIQDGNLAFISKNISKFTNDEINESIARYKTMQSLKDLENANKKDSGYYIDKTLKFLERADKATSFVTNMVTKTSNASKAVSESRKAATELAYLKNPDLKPLTEMEKLKNEKQRQENIKTQNETKQTVIDTHWKEFTDKEKYKDYYDTNMSVNDFKNKWGSYDNSGGGKAKGGGNQGKKISKDDFVKNMQALDPSLDKSDLEKQYDTMFSGQQGKKSLGGWFSRKSKEQVNKENNSDFDPDDKGVNIMTRKYLNQLKESPRDYFKEDTVRDKQWRKDVNKQDAKVIDKWIKDMKKKYMKERNLDSKAAEEKAEEYVSGWLEAYDEELLENIQKSLF